MRSTICQLHSQRFAQAKKAYTTRRVLPDAAATLLTGDLTPRAGDLVLARVDRIGHHKQLELTSGRRAHLLVGDTIVVCYGNRYAPDQFESVVPGTLGPCSLVAAGGVAGEVLSKHEKTRRATQITPLGLVGDCHGVPLNLEDWALPKMAFPISRPLTLAVVGTAMNAGKTTTAAYLVKGLVAAGLRVGSAKVTGTGAGGDRWFMLDAGADPALDFVDTGFVSTYRASLAQVRDIAATLIGHLSEIGTDAIVLELADGLYQEETAGLLRSPSFAESLDRVIFAAGDAMGASGGVEWLRRHSLPVYAISGLLTRSPLAVRETETVTDVPVLTLETLGDPDIAAALINGLGVTSLAA